MKGLSKVRIAVTHRAGERDLWLGRRTLGTSGIPVVF